MSDAVPLDNTPWVLAARGSEINRELDKAYRLGDTEQAQLLFQAMQDNAAAREALGSSPEPIPIPMPEPPSDVASPEPSIMVEDL